MGVGIQLHDVDTVVECRLLIAHPTRPRVLAVRRAGAWALPALTPLEQHVAAVSHINLAAFRLFGLRTHVRRLILERSEDPGYHSILRIYELEAIGELAGQRIERTVWAGSDVLGEMDFKPGPDRDIITTWLDNYAADEPEISGPPWSRRGWFEAASAWMQRQASASGVKVRGIPDQHWTSDDINVLTLASEEGMILMTASLGPASGGRVSGGPASGGPVSGSPERIESSEWASRLGWTNLDLIASDPTRNWSLYRTASASTHYPALR